MPYRKRSGIYAIHSEINGRTYVGSAKSIYSRWGSHRLCLRRGNHANIHLQNAWNKYGEGAFKFVILEECAKELLIEREQYWFDQYQDKYNLTPVAGSWLGKKHSAESRAKISAAGKGRTHTPEARAKISAGNKGNSNWAGKTHSPETRAKISAASKAHANTEQGRATLDAAREKSTRFTGRTHSPETKAKMSAAALGRKISNETRARMRAAAIARETQKREAKIRSSDISP